MSLINLNQLTNAIANACIPIICLLITAGGAYLVALLRKRTAIIEAETNSDLASKYIGMAVDAVDQAVTFVAQTFVDALKSENAFTKERQLEAFNMARDKVLSILGTTAVQYLNELYGDFEAWLETKIEQQCYNIKQPAATQAFLVVEPISVETVETVEITTEGGTEEAAPEEPSDSEDQPPDADEPEVEDPDADYEY